MLVLYNKDNVIMEDKIVESLPESSKVFLHCSEEQDKFIEERLKQCPLTKLQSQGNEVSET